MARDYEKEDKAGWNSSEEIIKTISVLRNTYLSCKLDEDFPRALETIRCILDVISGKVSLDKIEELNRKIYTIEEFLPTAVATYNHDGMVIPSNPILRLKAKRLIEVLYRALEKLQNECGYGMVSQDDPRFAVEMR